MLDLTKDNFNAEVLEYKDGYVFVDFYGDGCVPCAALMPFVHACADKYGDKIKFCSLNTTKARRLAMHHNVTVKISEYSFDGGTRAVIPGKHILIDNSFETKLNEARHEFKFDLGGK